MQVCNKARLMHGAGLDNQNNASWLGSAAVVNYHTNIVTGAPHTCVQLAVNKVKLHAASILRHDLTRSLAPMATGSDFETSPISITMSRFMMRPIADWGEVTHSSDNTLQCAQCCGQRSCLGEFVGSVGMFAPSSIFSKEIVLCNLLDIMFRWQITYTYQV